MTGVVLVTGVLMLAAGLHQAGCMVYHVTFLGRTNSQSKVGELHYQGTTNSPTVTNEVGCIWEKEGSSNIKKLLPNGTCPGLIPNAVGISEAGFKVESSDDFILHVYQSDSTGALADGFLAIPDEHLGNEYYVITYCSLGGFCQFAVVGTVDKTSVNIVFPRQVSPTVITCNGVTLPASAPPGDPIPFSLNENEVLHFESSASNTDLSGTYIASSHEVSVFVGARDVPSASGSAAYMIEQIPPVNKWGTDFVVAPNVLNDAGDIIKIVSQSEETTVHILGFSPFTISDKGEAVEWRIDWEMHSSVRASKPVLIVQVMSLNIYNDTEIVTGSPAMVLVPHVKQWTDKKVYSDCLQKAHDKSILTTVVVKGDGLGVAWAPPAPSAHWDPIEGSDYEVQKFVLTSSDTEERMSQLVNRSTYGYCDGKSAVLLHAEWTWENEECIPTSPVPGDGVDNDCDGKIDEDTCTEEDIRIMFTSTQNASTGGTTVKAINVKGASPLGLSVTSCDIAVVSLQTTTEPKMSYTAMITPKDVIFQVCTPECRENGTLPISVTDCTAEQSYKITWSTTSGTTSHIFETQNGGNHYFDIPDTDIDYDVMFITAFSQTADFVIDLPEKDCSKVKSGDADNFGFKFVVPVDPTDNMFSIFLANANANPVSVVLRSDSGKQIPKDVAALKTEVVKKTDLDAPSHIMIEADGEISVYVVRTTASLKTVGFSVIPFDTLGPNYHVYLDKSLEDATTPDSETICSSHATTDNTDLTNIGPLPVVVDITKALYKTELGHQKLLTANRPIAVFCGASDTMAQIPPRETLGEMHYIPPLAFDTTLEEAEILLVATEDSTVVIIRGNYDNLDTVNLTGNTFTREVVPNTLYSISATKPIQVHLKLGSKVEANGWASVVLIPPVEQYKSKHIFPGILSDFYQINMPLTIVSSNAVNTNGDSSTSKVNQHVLGNPAVQVLNYAEKSFSLTLLNTASGRKLIVASDVMYNEINKVCTRTTGTPGDGEDNDCDGLIDEEQCTVNIEPGEIDADIDGSFNEDCANGTTPPSLSSIDLSLTTTTITCPADTNTGSGSGSETGSSSNGGDARSIVIDNGMLQAPPNSQVAHPNVQTPSGSAPSYQPLENVPGGIILPELATTTGAPGNTGTTPAPVETCRTDCVCPCGWVNPPKNYTPEELEAVVMEIQEKLKVTKTSLSAVIRAKSSAKDDRTEAAAVGVVGVVFLVAMFTAMVLLDLTTLARDIRLLIGNLRQVFQP